MKNIWNFYEAFYGKVLLQIGVQKQKFGVKRKILDFLRSFFRDNFVINRCNNAKNWNV